MSNLNKLALFISLFFGLNLLKGQSLVRYQDENEKYGYKDQSGQVIINPKFDFAHSFSEGLALVGILDNQELKYGFINAQGEWKVNMKYNEGKDFSQGLAAVRSGDTWGYIDYYGNTVFSFHFEVAESFSRGGAWVAKGGEKYLTRSGKMYDGFTQNWGKLATVYVKYKQGLIDTLGNEILAPLYDEITPISQNSFRVTLEGRDAILDSTNRLITTVYPFRKDKKFGLVNFEGKEILKPKYDDIESTEYDIFIARYKGKYGILDKSGNEIHPCKFNSIDLFIGGKAFVMEGEKEFYIDRYGKIIR